MENIKKTEGISIIPAVIEDLKKIAEKFNVDFKTVP